MNRAHRLNWQEFCKEPEFTPDENMAWTNLCNDVRSEPRNGPLFQLLESVPDLEEEDYYTDTYEELAEWADVHRRNKRRKIEAYLEYKKKE